MPVDQYRAFLDQFGYTQEGFAMALGYAKRAGQRWASGETAIPGAVAVVARLLLARPEAVTVLAEIAPMPSAERKSKAGRKPATKPARPKKLEKSAP